MKTAAEIADILRWLCHGATVLAVLWVGGSALNTATATLLILAIAGADYLIHRLLRFVADWLTSHTHV